MADKDEIEDSNEVAEYDEKVIFFLFSIFFCLLI
jgi:hypothetical protein